MKKPCDDKFFIQSINRALTIVDAISKAQGKGLTLTEISEHVDLHISTVYRILQNLIAWNYVKEDEDGGYILGFELITLGNAAKNNIGLQNLAHPYLVELGNLSGETIYLAIFDEINVSVMYIDKIDNKGNIRLAAGIGSRNRIHSTANGKVLVSGFTDEKIGSMLEIAGMNANTSFTITDPERFLNEIHKVRERGYAVDDLENEPGVRCVAAPIYDYRKKIIGSVSISGVASAVTAEAIEEKLKPLLLKTTESISKELGFRRS
ncbi:MAG: IclR family transcriptional regulator [Clostridiaceae bacterium]|nr:IclR family transcriptional regulator [Clostridiaceae bacterium]